MPEQCTTCMFSNSALTVYFASKFKRYIQFWRYYLKTAIDDSLIIHVLISSITLEWVNC